jgi:hypothetical protein
MNRPIVYSWMALAGGARLHFGKYEESAAWLVLSVIDGPRFPLKHERHSYCPSEPSNSLRPSAQRKTAIFRSGTIKIGETSGPRLESPWPGDDECAAYRACGALPARR